MKHADTEGQKVEKEVEANTYVRIFILLLLPILFLELIDFDNYCIVLPRITHVTGSFD